MDHFDVLVKKHKNGTKISFLSEEAQRFAEAHDLPMFVRVNKEGFWHSPELGPVSFSDFRRAMSEWGLSVGGK